MDFRRNQSTIGCTSFVRFALALLILCVLLPLADGFGGFQSFAGTAKRGVVVLRMSTSTEDRFPIEKTDDEWKEQLTMDQYYILRKEGTETPGASILNQISVEKNGQADAGTFLCAGCDHPLFIASAKYDSGTGWPSFYQPLSGSAVALSTDYKMVVPRTEVLCSQCGGHLGHVFEGMFCFVLCKMK